MSELMDLLSRCANRWIYKGLTIEERWTNLMGQINCFGTSQNLYGIFIQSRGMCYSRKEDGFIWEPQPSSRDDEFLKDTRFTLEDAVKQIDNMGTKKR